MKLGMIGLGRMGGNMTERLRQHGHEVVSYARSGGGTASMKIPASAAATMPATDAPTRTLPIAKARSRSG